MSWPACSWRQWQVPCRQRGGRRRRHPITIVINQSPWFAGFRKLGRGLREGDRQQGQARRQPVRRQRREAAQLGARGGGPVRHPGHELGLARRVLSRRLPRAAQRHRSRLQARSAGHQLRRHRVLGREDEDATTRRPACSTACRSTATSRCSTTAPTSTRRPASRCPQTWDELLANAEKLHNPPRDLRHGPARRAQRPTSRLRLDALPARPRRRHLQGREGRRLHRHDQQPRRAKKALDIYVELARKSGPPNPGSYGQAQVIQALVTGKAAHATPVIAAWPQMDDPTKSAVVGKINVAPCRRMRRAASRRRRSATSSAHPEEHPEGAAGAALAFLRWFQTPTTRRSSTRRPAAPRSQRRLRRAVHEEAGSSAGRRRWREARRTRMMYTVPEAAQIADARAAPQPGGDRREDSAEALNTMAAEIHG